MARKFRPLLSERDATILESLDSKMLIKTLLDAFNSRSAKPLGIARFRAVVQGLIDAGHILSIIESGLVYFQRTTTGSLTLAKLKAVK